MTAIDTSTALVATLHDRATLVATLQNPDITSWGS
jgi:hypothetical protein